MYRWPFFLVNNNPKSVFKYSLKTPWSLGDGSTGTDNAVDFVQSSSIIGFPFAKDVTDPNDLYLKDNGETLFVLDRRDTRSALYEFSLSIPWDITSGSGGSMEFVQSASIVYNSGTSENIHTFAFHPSGSQLFTIADTGEKFYEYTLDIDGAWDDLQGDGEFQLGEPLSEIIGIFFLLNLSQTT